MLRRVVHAKASGAWNAWHVYVEARMRGMDRLAAAARRLRSRGLGKAWSTWAQVAADRLRLVAIGRRAMQSGKVWAFMRWSANARGGGESQQKERAFLARMLNQKLKLAWEVRLPYMEESLPCSDT